MNRFVKSGVISAAILIVTAGVGFSIATATQSKAVTAHPDHIVNLLEDQANPSAIAVTRGDYVQFNAKAGGTYNIGQGRGDDEVHQQAHADVHEHNYDGKESGNFGSGQGYRVQFNKIGTYDFHDHYNPKISVTVIVYEKRSN